MTTYILGMDEAGRGPLIGNLYIVGVLLKKEEMEKLSGDIKDSKKLTHKKREKIFKEYKDKVVFFVREIKPHEIDSKNLNQLEAEYFQEIIKEALNYLKNKEKDFKLEVYIDLLEKKEKFLKRLNLNDSRIKLVLEHKADQKYKTVSLASIFAKVFRENHVKNLKNYLRMDFGSGYPSDPKTKELVELLKKDKKLLKLFKPYIRKKWNTVKFLFNNNSLFDFIKKI
jgi:ribonuclease HII